ncbi:MAG: endonuclease domain-containing protein [Thermoproteota archaeon]|nr:endonuclease domain-containing protein [Thermoproteota archaeon]
MVCGSVSQGLYSLGIEITLEPEIWYTSCNFYTPDLLVNNRVIIEVDGPLHEDLKIKKNDRIRQRALENTGYVVYRFKNQEIVESLGDLIIQIKYILSQSRGINPKLFEIDVPEGNRMSNISENFVKAYASALNSTLITIDRWNATYFKEFLSRYDQSPIGNRCAMEKLIFTILGLSLRSKDYQDEPVIDFEHYFILFDKSIAIMNELFGKSSEIELRNAFNITATNFMKNLIFYGKPRVAASRLVWIKDYKSIVSHINEFNEYFARFGIAVEESEVKLECLGELDKIEGGLQERARFSRLIKNDKISKSKMNQFSWLEIWLEEAKSLHWLTEWLGYKKSLYHNRL